MRGCVAASGMLLALLAGCSGDGVRDDGAVAGDVVGRDSAGVRIVESDRPRWADGEGWIVDPEPLVHLGVENGPAEHRFDRVRAVRFLSDGRLAVADEGSSQIRIFDERGRLVHVFGSRGEGPGEFTQLYGLWVTIGDTLYARAGNVRDGTMFHVFTSAGRLIRSFTVPRIVGDSPGATTRREVQSPAGVFRNGEILTLSTPQPTGERSGRWLDSTTLLRFTPDGSERDTLARLPMMESARERFRSSQDVVFGPMIALDIQDDRLVVGYPQRFELHVLDADGSLVRTLRRSWTPVPVTEEQRSAYRDALINLGGEDGRAVSPRLQQQRRDLIDDAVFAEQLPAFGMVQASSDGHLWVAETDLEDQLRRRFGRGSRAGVGRWTVFDPAGRWLGPVELPPGFEPRDFGVDRIAGIWRDENDVEHVRVLAIRRR